MAFCMINCKDKNETEEDLDFRLNTDLVADNTFYMERQDDLININDVFPDRAINLDMLSIPEIDGPCGFSKMCTLYKKTKKACCCVNSTPMSACCPKACAWMPIGACLSGTNICLTFCNTCTPPGWKTK